MFAEYGGRVAIVGDPKDHSSTDLIKTISESKVARVWKSRNKTDLIIEVWEKLDCESVGAARSKRSRPSVEDVFGKPRSIRR